MLFESCMDKSLSKLVSSSMVSTFNIFSRIDGTFKSLLIIAKIEDLALDEPVSANILVGFPSAEPKLTPSFFQREGYHKVAFPMRHCNAVLDACRYLFFSRNNGIYNGLVILFFNFAAPNHQVRHLANDFLFCFSLQPKRITPLLNHLPELHDHPIFRLKIVRAPAPHLLTHHVLSFLTSATTWLHMTLLSFSITV